MTAPDVVVAGGGVSGLLIASALASRCSVLLIEQAQSLPLNKYWLTDHASIAQNAHLGDCINRRYDFIDFIAYDGLTARVRGTYDLWDTEKLVGRLHDQFVSRGGHILSGHRIYSLSMARTHITIRANADAIRTRLLIDCMGFGSPLVGAKDVATIIGYYILQGREVDLATDVAPVALHNVVIARRPAYLELFPTSQRTAHASLIVPSRYHKPERPLSAELDFILHKSEYRNRIAPRPRGDSRTYFGIIPVGRLRTQALDRVVFFGEAGQANPAASAAGLSRMLRTYNQLAESIAESLDRDRLTAGALRSAIPVYMSKLNRVFQETLFDSILSFNSDDFRQLVKEMRRYNSDVVNDLIFAEYAFASPRTLGLLGGSLRRSSLLGRHLLQSMPRILWPRRQRPRRTR